VSNPAGNGGRPEREAFAALESAVAQALERLAHMGRRVQAAEAKSAELDEVVRRFTGDQGESGRILSRLRYLEEENADLRRRLAEGRAGIERLLAKVRFLENQQ
jgi:predicted RNase H-like nuclease (RuvC/YqgF family)